MHARPGLQAEGEQGWDEPCSCPALSSSCSTCTCSGPSSLSEILCDKGCTQASGSLFLHETSTLAQYEKTGAIEIKQCLSGGYRGFPSSFWPCQLHTQSWRPGCGVAWSPELFPVAQATLCTFCCVLSPFFLACPDSLFPVLGSQVLQPAREFAWDKLCYLSKVLVKI